MIQTEASTQQTKGNCTHSKANLGGHQQYSPPLINSATQNHHPAIWTADSDSSYHTRWKFFRPDHIQLCFLPTHADHFVHGEDNCRSYEVDEEHGFLDDAGGPVENGQDVHDNDQLVSQPEPVEDQATSRLSGVHVDNADTYNQEDTGKTCKTAPSLHQKVTSKT